MPRAHHSRLLPLQTTRVPDKVTTRKRALSAHDTAKIHRESVAWLTDQLAKCDAERTIVVTHHAPSKRSEASYHAGSPMSPAFVSNLDSLIEGSRASQGHRNPKQHRQPSRHDQLHGHHRHEREPVLLSRGRGRAKSFSASRVCSPGAGRCKAPALYSCRYRPHLPQDGHRRPLQSPEEAPLFRPPMK